MWILCKAEDSHEKSGIIFFKSKNIKVSSAAIFVRRFKG